MWLAIGVAIAVLVVAGGALAQGGSAGASAQEPQRGASPFSPPEPGKPKPRAVSPATFAPNAAAALSDRRMTPEQREEWRFLKEAAAASRFEAEAARMALGKSSHPGVRSYAAALINHHTSAGNELQHMWQTRGMAPPMLPNDQRRTLNRLAKLQGGKFDREFVQAVALKRQQQDVEGFERASLTTRDPQLKAWIDRTLPTMRYHLATAERLAPAPGRVIKSPPPLRGPAGAQQVRRQAPVHAGPVRASYAASSASSSR
jgi:putative membrane protein